MSQSILGARLQARREKQGLSLEDVQRRIHEQTEYFYSLGSLEELEYDPEEETLTRLSQYCTAIGTSLIEAVADSPYGDDLTVEGPDAAALVVWREAFDKTRDAIWHLEGWLGIVKTTLAAMQDAETVRRVEVAQAARKEGER